MINTIMMNYIAFRLSDWLLNGPMKRPGGYRPISPEIEPSAWLPSISPDPSASTLAFLIALACCGAVYWLLVQDDHRL